MKKIKFFLNPIFNLEKWLNKMSSKGYRLINIKNFIYEFEKTDNNYLYVVQYIGADNWNEMVGYIDMLKDMGYNTHFTSINQGSLALGKYKLRIYKTEPGFVSNSSGYNRELLIVESNKEKSVPLYTNNISMVSQYKKIENTYLYGVVVMFIFIFSITGTYFVARDVTCIISFIDLRSIVLLSTIPFFVIFVYLLRIYLYARKKRIKSENESRIIE